MEPDQNQQTPEVQEQKVEAPKEAVSSFTPIPVKSSKKGGLKTFLGIFILVIFVVGGFLIFKDSNKSKVEATPSPETQGLNTEITPAPTSSSAPLDKTKVTVTIQNGTGIAGEAAYLRDILKSAGYSTFTLGNAPTSDNTTTTVTYSASLDASVQTEITSKLNTIYKEVKASNSSTQTDDVVIVTGLKKGATALPSATPAPSASPTNAPE